MVHYTIAALTTFILASSNNRVASAHETENSHSHVSSSTNPAFTYLATSLPTTLSDTDEAIVDFNDMKRIILTGGCDSPKGNEYKEAEWGGYFDCNILSNRTIAFDPVKDSDGVWNGEYEMLSEMPRKRARHVSVVVGGMVCLLGGRDETDGLVAEIDVSTSDRRYESFEAMSLYCSICFLMSDLPSAFIPPLHHSSTVLRSKHQHVVLSRLSPRGVPKFRCRCICRWQHCLPYWWMGCRLHCP